MNRRAASAAMLVLAGCASPGTPPGGPVDTQAPQIVRIAPDSAKTSVRPREVIFQFDEVVNERPAGAATLGALFLISPRNGEPHADWHRSEVAVRPERGFKANTTYTINMLPGISDLRGNTRNTGAVTVFSTGPTLAGSRITGTLFNWAEGRTITRGVIEARPLTDTSTVYVTVTDSVGDFALRNVPNERYRVRGYSDENNNRGIDPREPYDTVIVSLSDSARVELLAFSHDSTGTRLSSVTVRDSVTLDLHFDNALSVTSLPTAGSVHVRGSDSTDISVVSVLPPTPDTTPTVPRTPAGAVAPPPGTAAKPGAPAVTTPAAIVRKPSRPAPYRSLIVKLSRPLRPKITYRVRVTDVQNLIGVARTSERDVSIPAAPAPAAPVPGKPPVAVPPAAPVSVPVKK